jgi:nicotinate-nucleotide pyrophosphorylase (carboxylating)
MTMSQTSQATRTREQRLERALFRGATLTLENPDYLATVRTLTDTLLRTDLTPGDLTVEALRLDVEPAKAIILAHESGVAAGLAELEWMLRAHGVEVAAKKNDGDAFESGETLLELASSRTRLLSLERVGLNLVQRMCGIASAARKLQDRVRRRNSVTRVVGTRKTPWGLLDKRALHLGGCGTHRIGLGDAILIKNNHLALIASREEEAAPRAIERVWDSRERSAFIEVEVRGETAALAAAKTFRRLLADTSEEYPCLLLLDNMKPEEISRILESLRRENIWDSVLIEASGGIAESNIEGYADSGVDAISVGALTHSARALDLSQRIL